MSTSNASNNFDAFDIMMLLPTDALEELQFRFGLLDKGLPLSHFISTMMEFLECPDSKDAPHIDFIVHLIDLFRQVDVNGDGTMEWGEFTNFIVESGMAIGKELSVDHFHKGPRFHLILTKTNGEGLFTMKAAYIPHPIHQIAMIDFGNMPMRLCSPISLSCASLLAHRTGFMPHEVLAVIYIPQHEKLVTSSRSNGKSFVHFWSISHDRTTSLEKSVETLYEQKIFCWFPVIKLLFSSSGTFSRPGSNFASQFVDTSEPVKQKKQVSVFTGHKKKKSLVPSGFRSMRPGNAILQWNVDRYSIRRSLENHASYVTALICLERKNSRQSYLVSASEDGTICIWNARSGTVLKTLIAHEHGVQDLCCYPRRRRIFSVGIGKPNEKETLDILVWQPWNTISSEDEAEPSPVGSVSSPKFVPISNRTLQFTRMSVDSIEESGVVDSHFVCRLTGHSAPIIAIEIIESLNQVVSVDSSGIVKIWDALEMLVIQSIQLFSSTEESKPFAVTSMLVIDKNDTHRDGANFLGPSKIRRAQSCVKSRLTPLDISNDYTLDVGAYQVITPMLLFTGDMTRILALKDVNSSRQPIVATLFNPVSLTIVTAFRNFIAIWDATTGKRLRIFGPALLWEHRGIQSNKTPKEITAFCFDDRKRKFIIGTDCGTVQVHNYLNGAFMKYLDPHNHEITGLIYCNDSKCVLSTSWNSTMHITDERSPHGCDIGARRSVILRSVTVVFSMSTNGSDCTSKSQSSSKCITDFIKGRDCGTRMTNSRQYQRRASIDRLSRSAQNTLEGRQENQTDILCSAYSSRLNIIATGIRKAHEGNFILLFNFETVKLIGMCTDIKSWGLDKMPEVSAVSFLEPYAGLLSCFITGEIILWGTPPSPVAFRKLALFQLNLCPPAAPRKLSSVTDNCENDDQSSSNDSTLDSENAAYVACLVVAKKEDNPNPKFNRRVPSLVIYTGDDMGNIHFFVLPASLLQMLALGPVQSCQKDTYYPYRSKQVVMNEWSIKEAYEEQKKWQRKSVEQVLLDHYQMEINRCNEMQNETFNGAGEQHKSSIETPFDLSNRTQHRRETNFTSMRSDLSSQPKVDWFAKKLATANHPIRKSIRSLNRPELQTAGLQQSAFKSRSTLKGAKREQIRPEILSNVLEIPFKDSKTDNVSQDGEQMEEIVSFIPTHNLGFRRELEHKKTISEVVSEALFHLEYPVVAKHYWKAHEGSITSIQYICPTKEEPGTSIQTDEQHSYSCENSTGSMEEGGVTEHILLTGGIDGIARVWSVSDGKHELRGELDSAQPSVQNACETETANALSERSEISKETDLSNQGTLFEGDKVSHGTTSAFLDKILNQPRSLVWEQSPIRSKKSPTRTFWKFPIDLDSKIVEDKLQATTIIAELEENEEYFATQSMAGHSCCTPIHAYPHSSGKLNEFVSSVMKNAITNPPEQDTRREFILTALHSPPNRRSQEHIVDKTSPVSAKSPYLTLEHPTKSFRTMTKSPKSLDRNVLLNGSYSPSPPPISVRPRSQSASSFAQRVASSKSIEAAIMHKMNYSPSPIRKRVGGGWKIQVPEMPMIRTMNNTQFPNGAVKGVANDPHFTRASTTPSSELYLLSGGLSTRHSTQSHTQSPQSTPHTPMRYFRQPSPIGTVRKSLSRPTTPVQSQFLREIRKRPHSAAPQRSSHNFF